MSYEFHVAKLADLQSFWKCEHDFKSFRSLAIQSQIEPMWEQVSFFEETESMPEMAHELKGLNLMSEAAHEKRTKTQGA